MNMNRIPAEPTLEWPAEIETGRQRIDAARDARVGRIPDSRKTVDEPHLGSVEIEAALAAQT